MPVSARALQRHRCNLETAPGDGVEVNRNVGLTQVCNKQKAGKTHPFGILHLAVLAAKFRSGETPCCWVYSISGGSRVDMGRFPASMCLLGWGRAYTPGSFRLLLLPPSLSSITRDRKTSACLGFHPQETLAGLVFAVGGRLGRLLRSFAPRRPESV